MARLDRRHPFNMVRQLLWDPSYYWYTACLVLVGDALLTQLIIRYVSYTEIDFTTYMAQVDLYNAGQRNYYLIGGPSGPLVYPAGHVHIHRVLHHITNGGKNQLASQQIYAGLYSANQFLHMILFYLAGGVPNWVLPILALSKRLHSIYVLRLFNDCWAVFFMLLSIIFHCKRSYFAAAALYSAALSIKMSVLLYLPGMLVLLVKDVGILNTARYIIIVFSVQLALAKAFLEKYPSEYLSRAFEFTRVFLYKWTVNWRFISEATFLSKSFSNTLLLGQLTTLVVFALYKWCGNDGGAILTLIRAFKRPDQGGALTKPSRSEIVTILFTTNLIGIIFARSLHYQFYAWCAQQVPFLLWRTKLPLALRFLLLGSIEWAWNIFPSTDTSSAILLVAHLMLLGGVWLGYPLGKGLQHPESDRDVTQ